MGLNLAVSSVVKPRRFSITFITLVCWIERTNPRQWQKAGVGHDQTCKTSADLRNSTVFDIFRVILEIRPDPRRKYFFHIGGGGPEHFSYKIYSKKRKIYISEYIFRANSELKHVISHTKIINKLYLFQINDI